MKAARTILVLHRYQIKQDCPEKGLHKGDIVLHVRNDKGKEYYTTLRRNKSHSCSCTGNAEYGRNCYHIKDLAEVENARYASARASKVVPITSIELAPLNGNRGFQLLKPAS